MHSFHIKKNDEVVVLSGKNRGKRGRVISVIGKRQRAIVEGVNMTHKHMRKSQQYPNGRILDREGPIHVSNLVRADIYDAKAAKRGAAPAKS